MLRSCARFVLSLVADKCLRDAEDSVTAALRLYLFIEGLRLSRGASGAIVEYKGGESAIRPLDDEDLEVKLRRISEQVPVRISNTSGSSAGSGSGDFHQFQWTPGRDRLEGDPHLCPLFHRHILDLLTYVMLEGPFGSKRLQVI